MTIRTQEDLNRVNITTAWAFSHRMTPAQFDQLLEVTVEQIHRDAGCGEPCLSRVGAHAD